jgi:hypothetical protein
MIIARKEKGKYKAFPTIVKTEDEYIIAYREGFTDITKPHGKNGCVKFLKSRDLKNWQEFKLPFCDNELDAIISGAFNGELFIATRSYEYKKRNDVYISKFKKDSIPDTRDLIKFDDAQFTMFGHIVKEKDELLAPAYGIYKGISSPMILSSNNFGKNWHIKSLITPNGFTPILNETSIAKFDDKFIAVMRSQEPSYELYCAFSDDLENWGNPQKIGILGHAPMVKLLKNGTLAFVFRDLNNDLPGVGLALSKNGADWEYKNICSYTGNLYNGGYADFVEIDNNKLFVVYYIADEDNEPWIEAKIIKL